VFMGWKRAAQVTAGGGGGGETEGTTERWQPWFERGWHGWCRYSDSVADERAHAVFHLPELSKPAQT
jgi:hypothetical protein